MKKPLQVWQRPDVPLLFCHIEGEEECLSVTTEEGNQQSRSNRAEVDHVVRIIRHLLPFNTFYFHHFLRLWGLILFLDLDFIRSLISKALKCSQTVIQQTVLTTVLSRIENKSNLQNKTINQLNNSIFFSSR